MMNPKWEYRDRVLNMCLIDKKPHYMEIPQYNLIVTKLKNDILSTKPKCSRI